MTIIVDSREQLPWEFEGVDVQRAKLEVGDYSVAGLERRVCVERKSLDDFVNTCLRQQHRFFVELRRMASMEMRCVIVEAEFSELLAETYRSGVPSTTMVGFVTSIIVDFRVPVYFAGDRGAAAALCVALLERCSKKLTAVEA